MRRYLALISSLLTGLLVSTVMSLATAPGIIQQYNAVCDPNFATRCIAPDASGNVPTTVSPSSGATVGIAPVVSAAINQSSLVLKATPGNLYGFSVEIGATSGYVMVFDAASLPANGAVTPIKCYPVTSNGTNGLLSVSWGSVPAVFTTGITLGFSTTGCFTQTASATAYFSGEVK